MHPRAFLSCDWGTSYFRLRLVETVELTVLAEIKTTEGVAHISQTFAPEQRRLKFEETFCRHSKSIMPKSKTVASHCVISGMASSSLGWMELPYAEAPLMLAARNLKTHTFVLPSEPSLTVSLVSGICTADDVMRGEECELLGLAAQHPDLILSPSCLILPGTHSKHISLEKDMLTGFTTYMTGEIYAQLPQMPTLKAALTAEGSYYENEFLAGVDAAKEFGLSASLFKIRARSLLSDRKDHHAPSFLSGALIADELLHVSFNRNVFLGGNMTLAGLYILAAERLDLPLQLLPPNILETALLHAHRNLLVI